MAALICGCFSCNDEFMERAPQTSITVPGFFKSVSDLNLYVNGLCNEQMPAPSYSDFNSDNVTYNNGEEVYLRLLYGRLSPDNATGWDDWGKLRSVNLMLNNLDGVSGEAADINHAVGIARYFRARFYISKVQQYSDVPWYEQVIGTADEDLLYKTQDPRKLIVEKIMEDLEYAVANINADMGNRTRIHKYAALAELARFALYEGVYRKYHPELNLASDANTFLERAVSASEEIMNSGEFEITGNSVPVRLRSDREIYGAEGFRALFSSLKLTGNKEMILWKEYGRDPYNYYHQATRNLMNSDNKYSLSRSLQESFLTKDGKPFSSVPGYDKKEFKEVFVNRDPRLAETFAWPGIYETVVGSTDTVCYVIVNQRGGYEQSKFYISAVSDNTRTPGGSLYQYTSLPVYRYGEILLIYAEAKAELGRLDAASIGKSINLLRARVGMPNFDANREVDAALRAQYPGVTDVNILAVRRERRVELAGEGFRKIDIYRWHAGKLFEAASSQQGIYIPRIPYVYDVTGDGVPDIGIARTKAERTGEQGLTWFDLDAVDFYLENSGSGYVRNNGDAECRFEEPKYYYSPIPKRQAGELNPNLKQPFGW
jgi:hypothetical protein